jgi:hypothetical protein
LRFALCLRPACAPMGGAGYEPNAYVREMLKEAKLLEGATGFVGPQRSLPNPQREMLWDSERDGGNEPRRGLQVTGAFRFWATLWDPYRFTSN